MPSELYFKKPPGIQIRPKWPKVGRTRIMSSGTVSSVRIFDQSSLGAKALMVLAASLALAISAKVQVPFWPVPMTMQTFVVLMIGVHFGPRLAALSVLAYLVEGAAGLPVFSTGAGIAFLAGPTGGYLIGFFASALLIATAVQRGYANSAFGLLAVLIIGDLVIFGFGFTRLATLIGTENAFMAGVVPFLPAEALKIALAFAASRVLSRA
jgi:biotin transport system substrate-specific component